MFINNAFAATEAAGMAGAAATGGSVFTSMLPLFIILAIFYLVVIRPQNKRLHEHREMLSNLKKGDRIVTGGGLIGKIKKAGEEELVVELAEGVDVHVLRSTVMKLKTNSDS